MDKTNENLSLAERARRALEENEKLRQVQDLAENAQKFSEKVRKTYVQARQASKIFNAAAEGVEAAAAFVMPLARPFIKAGGLLASAFKYAAFERDGHDFKRDSDGDLIFSPGRLARSFAVAACLGLSAIGAARYGYYYGTQFNEMVYVTGKQEIRDGDLYHVTGCTALPCSTQSDTGKYYQIERSLFAPFLMYPEEDVYANVPNQLAACHVQGYGIYFKELKPLFKWAQWYQNIENVSCRPLSEREMQLSMDPAP